MLICNTEFYKCTICSNTILRRLLLICFVLIYTSCLYLQVLYHFAAQYYEALLSQRYKAVVPTPNIELLLKMCYIYYMKCVLCASLYLQVTPLYFVLYVYFGCLQLNNKFVVVLADFLQRSYSKVLLI